MADNPLPDGDFTRSEFWPRLKYGLPDKSDILEAQNQTLAQFMVNEAQRRQTEQVQVMDRFDKLHGLVEAIAERGGMDLATIAKAQPSRASLATQTKNADRKAVANLSEALSAELFTLSKDFKASFPNDLKQTMTASVKSNNLVEKWATHVNTKLLEKFRTEWETLTDAQLSLLYIALAKSVAQDAKGKPKSATGKRGRKAAASAEQHEEEEGISNEDENDEDDFVPRKRPSNTTTRKTSSATGGNVQQSPMGEASRSMMTPATGLRAARPSASRGRLPFIESDEEEDVGDSIISHDGPWEMDQDDDLTLKFNKFHLGSRIGMEDFRGSTIRHSPLTGSLGNPSSGYRQSSFSLRQPSVGSSNTPLIRHQDESEADMFATESGSVERRRNVDLQQSGSYLSPDTAGQMSRSRIPKRQPSTLFKDEYHPGVDHD